MTALPIDVAALDLRIAGRGRRALGVGRDGDVGAVVLAREAV